MKIHHLQTVAKGRKCPNCGAPVVAEFRPFCSKRCATLDLSRWLNEDYRIPAVEDEEIDDDEFEQEEQPDT